MIRFDDYRDSFPNARLTRSKTGVLEVALHTDGGTLVFNGYTHEQFVDLFHAIGSDPRQPRSHPDRQRRCVHGDDQPWRLRFLHARRATTRSIARAGRSS